MSVELVGSQINVLLNKLYLEGKREFSIRSPTWDMDLFDVELDRREWRCVPSHDKNSFKEKVSEVRGKVPEHLQDDVPGYDSLRGVLVAAGAFEPEEFGGSLLNAVKRIKGNRGSYSLCFDTNVLYNRFISSTLFDMLDGFQYPPDMVLSNMMVDEIREKTNDRYETGFFKRSKGQYMLRSREAKIALSELDFLENGKGTLHFGDEDFSYDNEERDLRIIEEYAESSEFTDKKPLLMTFEKDFEEKVEGHDVDPVVLEYPSDLCDVGHERLYRVLRYSAQVFGIVELSDLECEVYGVWDGMRDEDFERGTVLVERGLDQVEVSDAVREVVG